MPRVAVTTLLLILSGSAVLLEILRRRSPQLEGALVSMSAGALRPAEEHGVTGATWLLIGYTATWLFFPSSAAAPAMLVAAAADPAAAAVGTAVSRTRGRKTIAGSAAALAVALAILLLTVAGVRAAIFAALAATLVERLPGRGLDNLLIPLATAAVLLFVR